MTTPWPRMVTARGLDYVNLATQLLQRIRRPRHDDDIWEAADLQWWWRKPRRSDEVDQMFWIDDEGPVAAVVLTDWQRHWACDLLASASADAEQLGCLMARAVEARDALQLQTVEMLIDDGDVRLAQLATEYGFVPTAEGSGHCWMDAPGHRTSAALAEGFTLTDRASHPDGPHPMIGRNGPAVESRLRECSLYDPGLDLSVRAPDGRVGGYSLFWFDPVTEAGLLEPMRVEDDFQRRGLARAMISEGVDRLAARGARRIKVGYSADAARSLYAGMGFRPTSHATAYRWQAPGH